MPRASRPRPPRLRLVRWRERGGVLARVALVSFFSFVFFSPPARAQVNTENLRKRIKAIGYSLIIEGTLTGDTGNTQGISVGGGIGGGWAHDPHLLFAYARFDYTKYAGVTSVDKTFAHVRYNYEFEKWLWGELFAQAQSDAFQRLELRNLFGIGPRARLFHDVIPKDFDVYAGTGYMFERDAITPLSRERPGRRTRPSRSGTAGATTSPSSGRSTRARSSPRRCTCSRRSPTSATCGSSARRF